MTWIIGKRRELVMCSYITLQCACWNLRKQMNEFLLHLRMLTMKITTNRGQFLELGISDHLTCLLRNLDAGQKARVRTGHETTDWFQIEKGVCQGCILSPCFSSVQFSRSVMSDSLQSHGLQHARPPCPSPTPGVYPN